MCATGDGTCGSSSQTRRATRARMRRPGVTLLFMAVIAVCSNSRGALAEDYDYGYGPPPPPMRADGGEGGGGFFGPLAFAAGSFLAGKLVFSGRRKNKNKTAYESQRKSLEVMKRDDLAAIHQQFNQMETQLTASLNEKIKQCKQLEQFLYSLPDLNQDGLITRLEFDKYMNDYKRTHPEISDRDLPRFEDMDHNRNGHINFNEWEEYQMMAMGAI